MIGVCLVSCCYNWCMARGDLTDGGWERIRKYLPISPLGRLPRNLRKQIDGVNWRYRTGSQWREVPERYGHWNTVYQLHRRYCQDGTWAAILLGVIAEVEELGDIDWFVSIDSTTVRAHQDASGAVVDDETLTEALAWVDATTQGASPRRQARPVPRRTDQQDPLRVRRKGPPLPGRRHRRPGRRQSAVHPGPRARQDQARARWEAPLASYCGRGRHGLRLPREPSPPAQAEDQS